MTGKNIKRDGISLRTIHLLMIIGAAVISGLMLYSTYSLSSSFRDLTEMSEQQIELRKAARELMDASDYLTEKVQRFTVLGDEKYLNQYFEEAFETNRREEAIEKMSLGKGSEEALARLNTAMEWSQDLMKREYYAMKLVIDAKGIENYPAQLKEVTLTSGDTERSAEEKMKLAANMVHDEEYYEEKDHIRENMRASLDELETMAYTSDASALEAIGNRMWRVRLMILIQTVGIVIIVWLTSWLGINPVLNAVERIREDSPIPEVGANEFRYLARAYNKMYEVYKTSLERLNFKASHDQLTGAYNRSGYDLLLSSLDLNSTYMLLFDLDNFKSINDTYGHETGDKVLQKLVTSLKKNFRSDDYVCRIGGDEFIVFMVHASDIKKSLIGEKVDKINNDMWNTEDGLPAASVSVGITRGSDVQDARGLFEATDKAMYHSKQKGKHAYTFYGGN